MSLQKYRADIQGETKLNGSIPFYASWMGGPSLALIRLCPIDMPETSPRTVYITGEPDTYFSIPAAITVKRKTVKGFVMCDEQGYTFHPNKF